MASLPRGVGRLQSALARRDRGGVRRALERRQSSLINALTGQKALARTSNTPGRTRELNFFTADIGLTIVDMPGYGYARAPKTEVAAWTRLVFDYLRGRANLRRVYLLVDARHGLKDNDVDALKLIDKAAVSYQVVLTKTDKLKAAEMERVVEETAAAIAKRAAAHRRSSPRHPTRARASTRSGRRSPGWCKEHSARSEISARFRPPLKGKVGAGAAKRL